MLSGILNIDKPKGLTSHDVVDLIRKAARQRKVGHSGTLDPIATGVLPICIGNATKLTEFMTAEEKEYQLVCRLGIETDSQDITGEVLATGDPAQVTLSEIEELLKDFTGSIKQTPPMVSAKRHNGKRLYELARQGIEVEREPVDVQIESIEILGYQNPDIELKVRCSKGTYVRTLCHDVGRRLGCGAVMASLTRTWCGSLCVKDAVDVALLNTPEDVINHLCSPDIALGRFPAIIIQDSEISYWLTGRSIRGGAILHASAEYEKDHLLRIKTRDGRLVGMGKAMFSSAQVQRLGGDIEVFKPVRVFPEPFSA